MSQSLHQTAAVEALEQGGAAVAWAALPAGELVLDAPAAGAAAQSIITRRAMPAPHHLAQLVLDQHA